MVPSAFVIWPPPSKAKLRFTERPRPAVSSEWLSTKNQSTALRQELESDIVAGRIGTGDTAKQQAYIRGMHRSIRPVFFLLISRNDQRSRNSIPALLSD